MKSPILTFVILLVLIINAYTQSEDKSITYYKDGIYKVGRQLKTRSEIKNMLANNPASETEYHKFTVTKKVGGITLITGTVITVAGGCVVMYETMDQMAKGVVSVLSGVTPDQENPQGVGLFFTGTGVMVVGAVILASNPHFKRSINLYNSSVKPISSKHVQFNLALVPNGLGIRMKF